MVTFRVSDKHPNAVSNLVRYDDGDHYLSSLPDYQQEGCYQVLQETEWNNGQFCAKRNGFVKGIIDAYSRHHNVAIRPDDVWLAIAAQFALFVNGNSEALRSLFVDHEGKIRLTVSQIAHLHSADYSRLASQMTVELKNNIKDKELCDWILPSFSTTTKNDVVVGSVMLMATLKSYFEYRFQLCCGIPNVTLLGTPEDWEEIHCRVDRLSNYGSECAKWSLMLKKITLKLLETSKGEVDVDFWSKICHHIGGGSGPSYISGWIAAFCVFSSNGKWQGDAVADRSRAQARAQRYRMLFQDESEPIEEKEENRLWPEINTNDIPPGYVTVEVLVDDNGKEYETIMFAGHMGYDVVEDGTAVAPKVAWAIVLRDKTKAEERIMQAKARRTRRRVE